MIQDPGQELAIPPITSADLGEFFDATFSRVFAYFVRRCASRSLAEDLTQDTFMAAADSIRKGAQVLDPDHWIFGLARHRLIDHFRALDREQRKLRLAWAAEHVSEQSLEGVEIVGERVQRVLAEMAPVQRLVLSLRYLDGLSPPEIASEIGRSLHATESLLSRGRQSFRRAYWESSRES